MRRSVKYQKRIRQTRKGGKINDKWINIGDVYIRESTGLMSKGNWYIVSSDNIGRANVKAGGTSYELNDKRVLDACESNRYSLSGIINPKEVRDKSNMSVLEYVNNVYTKLEDFKKIYIDDYVDNFKLIKTTIDPSYSYDTDNKLPTDQSIQISKNMFAMSKFIMQIKNVEQITYKDYKPIDGASSYIKKLGAINFMHHYRDNILPVAVPVTNAYPLN